MLRAMVFVGALALFPGIVSAQQPCTTDARRVVNEIYRHMLERGADAASSGWVDRLTSGRANVRDIVREVAKSPEHMQRFGNEATDQVVGTIYRHILGRQPDAEGQRTYTQVAQRSGLSAVIDDIVASREYDQAFGDWGVPGSGGLRYCGGSVSSSTSSTSTNSVNSTRDNRFAVMDRNGDGVISRSEWRGSLQSFRVHDWNSDGVLSGEEVRVGARSTDADYDLSDQFDYLDVNNNNRIDESEWHGSAQAFDWLDRDHSGWLSRAEVLEGRRGTTRFATVDENGDGQITLDEWRWSRRLFDEQDVNGDGILSPREFRGGGVPTTGR